MKNIQNYGVIRCTLGCAPQIKTNQDGSRRASVIAKHTDQDGNIHEVQFEGFIPRNNRGLGPYGYIRANEEVLIEYSIKSGNGGLSMQIDKISFGKAIRKNKAQASTRKNMTYDKFGEPQYEKKIIPLPKISTKKINIINYIPKRMFDLNPDLEVGWA